jgi:hypothetical protein
VDDQGAVRRGEIKRGKDGRKIARQLGRPPLFSRMRRAAVAAVSMLPSPHTQP